jgi:hypothetical protein
MKTMKAADLLRMYREAVLRASMEFEAKWTWRALRGVDPALAKRLREQIDIFDEACITGTPREIVEHGQATERGYAAAAQAMELHKVRVEAVALAKQGPNLQDLVAKHGGYDKITEEAWEEFERAKTVWHAKLRFGEFDTETEPSQQEDELR